MLTAVWSNSKAQGLFTSSDEALEFTDQFGFVTARAKLLEECHRHAEAAELHIQEGRLEEAVRLLLLPDDTDGVHRACECILHGLWNIMPLGTRLAYDSPEVRRLFDLVSRLPKDKLLEIHRDQVSPSSDD